MLRRNLPGLISATSLAILTLAACGASDETPAESTPTTSSFEPTSGHVKEEIGRPIGLFCRPSGTMESCSVQFTVTGIREVDPSSCDAPDDNAGSFAAIDVEVITRPEFSDPAAAAALKWDNWSYVDDLGFTVVEQDPAAGCRDDWNPDALYGDLPENSTIEATLVLRTPNGVRSVRVDPPQTPNAYEWEAPW